MFWLSRPVRARARRPLILFWSLYKVKKASYKREAFVDKRQQGEPRKKASRKTCFFLFDLKGWYGITARSVVYGIRRFAMARHHAIACSYLRIDALYYVEEAVHTILRKYTPKSIFRHFRYGKNDRSRSRGILSPGALIVSMVVYVVVKIRSPFDVVKHQGSGSFYLRQLWSDHVVGFSQLLPAQGCRIVTLSRKFVKRFRG